jgi:hypothetical protein
VKERKNISHEAMSRKQLRQPLLRDGHNKQNRRHAAAD